MTRSPVGVEPVNATLRTSGCVTSASPASGAGAGDDVEHARRQAGLGEDLGEAQRRERRRVGRLGDDRVAAHAAPGRACCTAASSGSSTARSPPTTPSGRRSTRPSTPGSRPCTYAPRTAFARPGVVLERVGRLAQLDPRLAQRLALLGDEQRDRARRRALESASAPAREHRAAVGVAARATSRRTRACGRAHGARRRRRRRRSRPRPTSSPVAGLRDRQRLARRCGCDGAVDERRRARARSAVAHAHAPTNSGARFSLNAVRPSLRVLRAEQLLDRARARAPGPSSSGTLERPRRPRA